MGELTNWNSVVSARTGQILSRDTILKEDHLLSGINLNLHPRFSDAPNFRKVKANLNIYAGAQASIAGKLFFIHSFLFNIILNN